MGVFSKILGGPAKSSRDELERSAAAELDQYTRATSPPPVNWGPPEGSEGQFAEEPPAGDESHT